MAKLTFPSITMPTASTFKGWAFVLVAGLVLALLAVIDRGGLDEPRSAADGSTGCQLEVAVPELNIRSAPANNAPVVDTLRTGEKIDGSRTITDGFRELENGRWAWNAYLTPLPGTNCA
ncbi:hypothetical protein WEH80_24415 [Actinomycetes bacterium KLBMP 9759]